MAIWLLKVAELRRLDTSFGYKGQFDIKDISNFIKSRLAREHIPRIALRMKPMIDRTDGRP